MLMILSTRKKEEREGGRKKEVGGARGNKNEMRKCSWNGYLVPSAVVLLLLNTNG